MVIVPSFCPEAPHLPKSPVFLDLSDNCRKPNPFTPDVVVSIDPAIDKKMGTLWQLLPFFGP